MHAEGFWIGVHQDRVATGMHDRRCRREEGVCRNQDILPPDPEHAQDDLQRACSAVDGYSMPDSAEPCESGFKFRAIFPKCELAVSQHLLYPFPDPGAVFRKKLTLSCRHVYPGSHRLCLGSAAANEDHSESS